MVSVSPSRGSTCDCQTDDRKACGTEVQAGNTAPFGARRGRFAATCLLCWRLHIVVAGLYTCYSSVSSSPSLWHHTLTVRRQGVEKVEPLSGRVLTPLQ